MLDADLSTAEGVQPDLSFNASLGYRLKVVREAFGLSQRELAKRAGMTNSNISMIEQGQISPSVQSLHKIIDAFPMTLAEFFSCQLLPDQSPVIRAREISAQAHTSIDGVLIQHFRQQGVSQQILLSRQDFPLSCVTSKTSASTDFSGWIITGNLNLHMATQVYRLTKGDGFYIRREQIYNFANPYSEIAEVVVASVDLNQ